MLYEVITIFVVSDNGFIAEIDTSGQMIRKSDEIGTDFEAITFRANARLIMSSRYLQ